MLCTICNEDILQGDDINCATCKEFSHFNYAGFREANFRKMSKMLKYQWSRSTCKTQRTPISQTTSQGKTQTITDERLKSVVNFINFMSYQFDDFNHQLKRLFITINNLKSENKRITEENVLLKKEKKTLSMRLNKLQQKSLDCHIEIVGVPEIENEFYTNTIQRILTKLCTHATTQRVFRLLSKFPDKARKFSVCLNSVNG